MSYSDLGQKLDAWWKEFEGKMREHPETFLLGSVAAGFLLQMLPIRSFVIFVVRIALFLVKPALVLWLGYRLYQWLGLQTKTQKSDVPTGTGS
jgi:hypothetical protein